MKLLCDCLNDPAILGSTRCSTKTLNSIDNHEALSFKLQTVLKHQLFADCWEEIVNYFYLSLYLTLYQVYISSSEMNTYGFIIATNINGKSCKQTFANPFEKLFVTLLKSPL